MRRALVIVFENDVYNTMFDILFRDLCDDPDVYFIVEKEFPENGIYRYLPSKKLRKWSFGLSNRLYLNYYELSKMVLKLNKTYDHVSVLMHNAGVRKPMYPLEMFRLLKNNASFNLIYLDVYDHMHTCRYANFLFENSVFDKVFTIDPADAQKYGMVLCYTPYSRINFEASFIKKDLMHKLYFCGWAGERMYQLYNIWKEAKKKNINVEYDLAGSKDYMDFYEGDERIRSIDHLSYEEVLKRTLKSSCVLDLTHKDQTALTLRPYEAVVYNKKLLTNNKSILEFKYYDSRYMQYFERVEDIDWDWINEEIPVDYGYKGDFSPTVLLEQLV